MFEKPDRRVDWPSRWRAWLTQAQLAARIKRDQTFARKYETGERMLSACWWGRSSAA